MLAKKDTYNKKQKLCYLIFNNISKLSTLKPFTLLKDRISIFL